MAHPPVHRVAGSYLRILRGVLPCPSPCHQVITVELAYGSRPFVTAKSDAMLATSVGFLTSSALAVRAPKHSTLWPKENLINLARAALLPTAGTQGYIAWVDADVTFENANWVVDTMNALDKKPGFVQVRCSRSMSLERRSLCVRLLSCV